MIPSIGWLYHAPWSRRFKTFYCRGSWAHELQVGPIVIQVRRIGKPEVVGLEGLRPTPHVRVWRDRFWR